MHRARPTSEQLGSADGPVVAVCDYVKLVADQIGRFVPQPFVPLGTDGFGFSDVRTALRRHFEVDAAHIVVAVLDALAQQGEVKGETVDEAIRRYELEPRRRPTPPSPVGDRGGTDPGAMVPFTSS